MHLLLQYALNTVNIVAIFLMLLGFSAILDDMDEGRFGGVNSFLYIYVAILTSMLHVYQWKIAGIINYSKCIHLCGAIAAIAVVFAVITEFLHIIGNYGNIEDRLGDIALYNKSIHRKISKINNQIDFSSLDSCGSTSGMDDWSRDMARILSEHSAVISSETNKINKLLEK